MPAYHVDAGDSSVAPRAFGSSSDAGTEAKIWIGSGTARNQTGCPMGYWGCSYPVEYNLDLVSCELCGNRVFAASAKYFSIRSP